MAYINNEYGIPLAQGELTTAIVYNLFSRKGAAKRYLDTAKQMLARRGLEEGRHYVIVQTLPEGKTIDQARVVAEAGYKKVVFGGGDGTHFEGLNGITLSGKGRPAACLWPLGTSCDGPQSVGMAYADPLEEIKDSYIQKWVDTLVDGVEKPLDLLSVEADHLERRLMSADAISFGVEPDILEDRVKHKDDYPWPFNLPKIDYGPSILKKILQFGTEAEITIRRGEGYYTVLKDTVYGASVQNTQVYAGSFILSEKIDWQDGLGDLFVFSNVGSYLQELAKQGIKNMLRSVDKEALHTFDELFQHGTHIVGEEFRFDFKSEVCMQVDGEPLGKTRSCIVRSHPAEVRVICPRY